MSSSVIERHPTQLLSEALGAMFPVVGASTAGGVLSRMGPMEWEIAQNRPVRVTISVDATGVVVAMDGPVDSPPAWFFPTLQAIVGLLRLEPNWNSYGSSPISLSTAELALAFLLETVAGSVPPPAVVPTTEGGLQFEWHRNGLDVEIDVLPSGDIQFLVADLRSNVQVEGDPRNLLPLQSAIDQLADS